MNFDLSDEQRALVSLAESLARRNSAHSTVSWNDAGEFPWTFMCELARHGLTGIDLPGSHGGQGLTLIDSILVIEAIARTSPHLADAVQATNFGAIRQLSAFGTRRVVEEVVKPVLAGDALATIAMTEPGGGSALSQLHTTASRSDGRVVVNGNKLFNSNGPHATHYVVWARFGPRSGETGAVVVPADTPGFSRGAPERFMSGEMHCALYFTDCHVPEDYILVEENGTRLMMPIFNIERLGNAARSYGYGEFAFRLATEYMLKRETAGGRLADYQGLRWKLADMRLQLESARLLLYRAATDLRNGLPDPLHTSLAKLAANEAGFGAAHQALEILGGYGYTEESPVTYVFKRTRGWMIAGGSVEIQRNRIAHEVIKRAERELAGGG